LFNRLARIPFTKEGYQKLLEQKAKFLAQRPKAVEDLRTAREMGDLSENGYYKAARANLSFLDGSIRRVERLIKLGFVVAKDHSGKVGVGSKVLVSDGKKDYTYTIVGGYESDPSQGTISHLSPIGKALIGGKENDLVEVDIPLGKVKYKIVKIFS